MNRYAELEVIPKLADYFHADAGAAIPADISGSKIVRFGTAVADPRLAGGGLIIDYIPAGSERIKRLVLEFSDTGMDFTFCEFLQ